MRIQVYVTSPLSFPEPSQILEKTKNKLDSTL